MIASLRLHQMKVRLIPTPVIVKGNGTIFLGGPPLRSRWPRLLHCSQSGVTDYMADGEASVMMMVVVGIWICL